MKQTLILVGFILGFLAPVQTQTLNQYLKAARKAYEEKDYFNTLKYLYHVQEQRDLEVDDQFFLAESARRFNAFTVAKESYQKIIASTSAEKFPSAYFNLAMAEKNLGEYDAAVKNFEQFVQKSSGNEKLSEQITIAKKEMEYCKWAREKVNTSSKKYELVNLSDSVNTVQSELSPYLFEDKLYYSSLRIISDDPAQKSQSQIFYMEPDSSVHFIPEFNDDKLNAAHLTYSQDGQKAFYTLCEYVNVSELRCKIYSRTKGKDGTWGEAIKLPETINQKDYTATHPQPGLDREGNKVLYFVSNKPGGLGGTDIYTVAMNGDTYGAIKNVKEVNSYLDDITPFFHYKQNALYFSSKGHKGLGGYDVFKMDFNDNSELEHLDAQINTSFDDLCYYLSPDERKTFISSNRLNSKFIDPTNEACCNDIWEVKLRYVDLNILTYNKLDSSDLISVQADLSLENDVIKEVLNEDGIDHRFALDFQNDYKVEVRKIGFKKAYVDVSTQGITSSTDMEEKVYLDPVVFKLNTSIIDSFTREGVLNALVKLTDCDGKIIDQQIDKNSNEYTFNLEPGKCYRLEVTEGAYKPYTYEFTTPELGYEDFILNKEVVLEPIPVSKLTLDGYLPLPLFYDNDMPDRRSKALTTNTEYPNLVTGYLSKRSEYVAGYAKNSQNPAEARRLVNEFFDEVAKGNNTFNDFSEHLLRYLMQGNTAELMVKAYASPKASEDYNFALSQRRIASILNHFRTYKNGLLEEFVNNGKLKITERPYGETQAPKGVSDDANNLRESVYSPQASRERKVLIIEIKSELTE